MALLLRMDLQALETRRFHDPNGTESYYVNNGGATSRFGAE